jgi:hypothetical protein
MTAAVLLAPQTIAIAIAAALLLAGVGVSVITLCAARAIVTKASRAATLVRTPDAVMETFRNEVESLRREIEQLRERDTSTVQAVSPRPAINLGKRSQALRLYKRGETPGQIATLLELPAQEVELLIKVHRLVLRSFSGQDGPPDRLAGA